jgi:putative selenate reductase
MSDLMTCISFGQLMEWIMAEHEKGHVFGVRIPYQADPKNTREIFGRHLETVIGPAAGPNSQLSQNIIASYYAGARFFELKTVQKMDGRELAACVAKPCIKADDEGYNCEWSTELTVPEAQHEYINAWVALHFLAKEYGLGAQDGFQFNISVGYDLAGIKTEKVNTFIDSMMEAGNTDTFRTARQWLLDHVSEFRNFTKEDIEAIPSGICNSVTISTLHGCPPKEIESIADYLLKEKHLNTFVKCNPTLLGYDFARATLDGMGYDYIVFGRFHFEDDLQYKDAVPMLQRLMDAAEEEGLAFGVKLTNTFPVDVTRDELPSKEMYMSGRPLYALTISLAAKLSKDFDGRLRIAMSGGADYFNIDRIVGCGIWPVTVATTILKTGGYQRFRQMAEKLDASGVKEWKGIDVEALEKLASDAVSDPHHLKAAKFPPSRKNDEKVPLLNCYLAPCKDHCPIHQDVPTYMMLSEKGDYRSALEVILDSNALPFMTGKICAHPCQSACTRNFYESQVHIRDTKLLCAENAFDEAIKGVKPQPSNNIRVAVIGGGPAGMAAANYLARGGCSVTLFEKRERLGGIVDYAIPDFRITQEEIGKDAALLDALGVEVKLGCEASVADLKTQGFEKIIVAVGATKPGRAGIEGYKEYGALEFLTEFNRTNGRVGIGRNVVVIGGGNTAMDVARAAGKNEGVENVYLVYRRTKRYMPADEEELQLAIDDGVIFKELLAPKLLENGTLTCAVTQLGAPDASGRASVSETSQTEEIPADTVITAVGEKCDREWYEANGIHTDDKGRPMADENLQTSVPGVYVIGDGLYGPSVIVKAEANAMKAAEAILGKKVSSDVSKKADAEEIYKKKGVLKEAGKTKDEGERCLSCSTICENCVDVCPNRANIEVIVKGAEMPQIVHVDYMCNECGNCRTFCPYASGPYQDKWTLFRCEEDFRNSKNDGFVVANATDRTYLVRYLGNESTVSSSDCGDIPDGIMDLMNTVVDDYPYMIYQ